MAVLESARVHGNPSTRSDVASDRRIAWMSFAAGWILLNRIAILRRSPFISAEAYSISTTVDAPRSVPIPVANVGWSVVPAMRADMDPMYRGIQW